MKKKQSFYYFYGKKNLLKIMRLLFILMTMTSMTISANSFSQEQRVTLDVKNVGAMELFKQIQKETNLFFVYNDADLISFNNISVSAKDEAVDVLLNRVFSGLEFLFEGNVIVVKPTVTPDEKKEVKKCVIKGKVVDEKKQPLPGVTVRLDSTTVGCATDAQGLFTLTLPVEKGRLIFSFVGFKQEIKNFKAGDELLVVLKEEVSDLDEVTVIAYGERNKKELISSISSVKSKDLEEVPSASLENLLQGHMAGVEVSNVSGAPGGGGTRVAIRGYNTLMQEGVNDGTPLYVVDGVPIQSFTSPLTGTNTLAEIDPMTIESVEVLKDAASAAIYGSRASNGVILITTKRGREGTAVFQANASYSWSCLPETPVQIQGNGERQWWLYAARNVRWGYSNNMTQQVYMPSSYNEAMGKAGAVYDYFWRNGASSILNKVPLERQLQDSLNPFYNNSTNWWKYTFRTGKILNANLQASGGTAKVKYMVGIGWYNERGIMVGSDFSRANLISNLNLTPRKNLSLDMRLSLSYTDMSSAGSGLSENKNIAYMTVKPTNQSTLIQSSGTVYDKIFEGLNEVSEKKYNFNIRSNTRLAYKIIEGLDISASLGIDYSQANGNNFRPSTLDAKYGLSLSTGSVIGSMLLQTEELLHYNFSIKERNNFDWLFGFSYTREAMNNLSGTGKGSPSNYIHYVISGMPTTKELDGKVQAMQTFQSGLEEKIMVSYFGRLAYNFDRKYLMEVTLRRDGSSVFGKNVRWATFPSIALGWNFSDESFMKNFWWLSHGKIRGSWGKSGQVFSSPYLAQGVLDLGSTFLGVSGMVPTQMQNQNLTWEKSDQYDLGLDVDLFDYRVKMKLDYYYKYTKSILWQTTLPGTVYFHTTMWDNAFEVSNQGIELETQFDILRDTEVKWRARFNISRNWNVLEKTYTGVDISNKYVIGKSTYQLRTYKNLGVAQSENDVPQYWDQQGNSKYLGNGGMVNPTRPGMNIIADLNGDGVITDKDLYFAGSTLPVAYGGIASEVKWKGFDLNVLFNYSLGRKMINAFRKSSLNFNSTSLGAVFEDYRNVSFWEKAGDNADYPTIDAIYSYNYGQFDGQIDSNIETVSFIRLKQLTLGYNLPSEWAKKCYLASVRVFFTGENLFLLTNYSGLDPENVDLLQGYDRMETYPSARKFTLGLTIKF
ncbi:MULTISPECIES: SusC/RagA family TonB-linked outer membrane protein [Butyricimonas]|uniref:SusC/RagA family TonB-linked outer membrane protein n=1 Tax=Butyricimonas TaxID=574697 RepID=UPI000B38D873|nr:MULTISPECIES: SusC/RagA family TonB-linked outer membrane protein [Butyricimonas]OUN67269.1 hypothetical protein B5G13_03280 [Butyricimonas sp. An62]